MVLHRVTASAAAVLLVFGLAACGSDPKPSASSHAPEPTASSSPTGSAAPVLPELAREKSARGARAFLDFWFDTVTYAMRTGDTKALASISAVECRGCNSLISMIDGIYGPGGRNEGGGWIPVEVLRDAGVSMPYQRFVVSVRQPKQRLIDEMGRTVSRDSTRRFGLYESQIWRSGRWYAYESVKAFEVRSK